MLWLVMNEWHKMKGKVRISIKGWYNVILDWINLSLRLELHKELFQKGMKEI
jgi:hypothetical protein